MHLIRLAPSGREILADPDETVLHAARLQNVALPYSCLNGSCGSCKAQLLDGRVHYPYQAPAALSEQERAAGAVLLCQAVACGDLHLRVREVPAVAGVPIRQLTVRASAPERLAADVIGLRLRLPAGERLQRLPGQYIDILAAGGKRRAFSLASSAQADELELHLKLNPGGGFSRWVLDEMQSDARLRIEGPLGTFVPRQDCVRPRLFLAGGTGFAPVKSLLEHFLAVPDEMRLALYRGAANRSGLYLDPLPRRWASEHARFRYVPVVVDADIDADADLAQGYPHQRLLDEHPRLEAYDVYMAGPPAMIEVARPALLAAGLPEDRLFYDSFDRAPAARVEAGPARVSDREHG